MNLNWVDYTIIGIIAVSAVISIVRGFVREVLSLVAWVAAFWVALTFSHRGAEYLTDYVQNPSVREATAFVVLFLATLLIVALVNYFIVQLVEKTGISGTDRFLGMIFGLARGVLIVALLVLLAGLTSIPKEPWWNQSTLLDHFVSLAVWIRDYLPADVAQNFKLE
jgi:membrane protein required for colicin V production